jgi:hypothetical protein
MPDAREHAAQNNTNEVVRVNMKLEIPDSTDFFKLQ